MRESLHGVKCTFGKCFQLKLPKLLLVLKALWSRHKKWQLAVQTWFTPYYHLVPRQQYLYQHSSFSTDFGRDLKEPFVCWPLFSQDFHKWFSFDLSHQLLSNQTAAHKNHKNEIRADLQIKLSNVHPILSVIWSILLLLKCPSIENRHHPSKTALRHWTEG